MQRKGILFVISGPSGVGKGTVKSTLLAGRDDIKLSISVTTRKPRPGEVDGVDYFFVDQETFMEQRGQEGFLEWACVYTNYYGTPRTFVEEMLADGLDVMLEIDIQGALQVKEKMPQGIFIFIAPPSLEELIHRLRSRGKDSEETIQRRLAAYEEEMNHIRYYDYIIINNTLSHAVQQIEAIIEAERCRLKNF